MATHIKKWPIGHSDYISDLESHLVVGLAELSEVAVDSEVFQVLELLPCDPPKRESRHGNYTQMFFSIRN